MSDILWCPNEETKAGSALAAFAQQNGHDPEDYDRLHAWSIADPGAFWSALWDFAGIIGDRTGPAFVPDPSHWMTGARFFPDAKINLAENLLRLPDDVIAVVERDETGAAWAQSAGALKAEVARVAEGLRQAGVGAGDRVAAVLPNRLEALVTLLATTSLGAVWTSCSPDFGTTAILDRVGQVRPKVLFAAPRYRYGGKEHDIGARIGEIARRMPDLAALVLVGDGGPSQGADYAEFGAPAPLSFTRVGFNEPVYVLYTSGTTGVPKAIVHRVGGVLLEQVKEHLLHGDVRPGDRVCWYTNTAWMMYHWLIAAMGCRATLVLYDGAPILKTPSGLDGRPLWQIVEEERLSHLGISPKYLATLADAGFVPRDAFDLSALRWLLSAGSPVSPHQYDWIYESVGSRMGFASISGGSEILGCFLLGSPVHKLRRGTLTAKSLGLAVSVMDDRNAPVIGRPGDLVCTEPFPSMPLTFWGDGGTERYHATYFADRSEIWTHGDLAEMREDGAWVIHGRADTTLNPGGVRIGTADIYNICERFDAVEDCIAFGRPVADDEEIVLCLKPADGSAIDAELVAAIRARLRAECSPRHVPAAVYAVSDIPYTLNRKRVEGAARAAATGREVRNTASLANPDALEIYRDLDQQDAL